MASKIQEKIITSPPESLICNHDLAGIQSQADYSKKIFAPQGKSCLGRIKNIYKQLCNPRKAMQEKVESARIEKLASALHLKLSGDDRGIIVDKNSLNELSSREEAQLIREALEPGCLFPQYQEAAQFVRGVLALGKKIEQLHHLSGKGTIDVNSVDCIRREMSDLMGSPVYQKRIDSDHTCVNFLQFLSIKLHAADGESILSEQAQKAGICSPPQSSYSMGKLADAIGGRLKQFVPFTFNHDTILNKIWWGVQHPERAYHSYQSETAPLSYNPNKGNPCYLGPRYERADGKTIQSYYGPAPTGDRVFEFGLLPAYRKLGVFEIYFNYQDTTHHPEKARIEEIQRIASKPENKNCLKHVVIGFDAKVKYPKMKALIKEFKTVEGFVNGYEAFLMKGMRDLKLETGFAVSEELLSDEQLSGLFSSAKAFFQKMGVDEILKNPQKNKEDVAQMMIMDIDARIAAAVLYKALNHVPNHIKAGMDKDLATCYVSARCKQHIDRGAVQSNTLRLYFRMFEDDSQLNQKEFEAISGAILGRAVNVEDRNILFRRYKRFDSLMRLIGDNHAALAESLRAYRDEYLK